MRAASLVLGLAGRDHLLGGVRVFPFGLGQVAQELPNAGIRRLAGGGLVEALGLQLHRVGCLANGGQTQRPNHPDRLADDEPLDILAADQRNMLAELLLVKLQQAMAMAVLFAAHLLELRGGDGIDGLQSLGEIVVNAGVFFLQGNGQGQDFAFAQALEGSHGVVFFQLRVTHFGNKPFGKSQLAEGSEGSGPSPALRAS